VGSGVGKKEDWSSGMSGVLPVGSTDTSDPTRSLRSMAPNPSNSHEALAGGSGQLLLANTSRGEIVRRVSVAEGTILALIAMSDGEFADYRPPCPSSENGGGCCPVWTGSGFGPTDRIQISFQHPSSTGPYGWPEWCGCSRQLDLHLGMDTCVCTAG
jgi:hypothetical protein